MIIDMKTHAIFYSILRVKKSLIILCSLQLIKWRELKKNLWNLNKFSNIVILKINSKALYSGKHFNQNFKNFALISMNNMNRIYIRLI